MHFQTAASENPDVHTAVNAISDQIEQGLGDAPDFILAAYSESHDPDAIRAGLAHRFPGAALLGSSTCRGLMTERGLFGFGKPALGVAALSDPGGAFGTAPVAIDGDISAAVARAVAQAQSAADRPGEVPDMIWMHTSPGCEERLIAGVQSAMGQDVLISGGSSADETIGGRWSQFDGSGLAGGAAIALIYSDLPITHHFQSGYLPTPMTGTVTRASGRHLIEIDGRPAADVYDEWTGGLVSKTRADGGNSILGASAWQPLGKSIGRVGPSPEMMVDCYCLLHPDSVRPDGAVSLFADVEEGLRLVLMKSGPDELIRRAEQVAATSLGLVPDGQKPAGALMVFCAGCMLALGDGMHAAAAGIRHAFGGLPFMGIFTFGEQGSFLNGTRQHGNLMISSSLFGNPGRGL